MSKGGLSLTVSGDWKKLNRVMLNLSKMGAMFEGQIVEDGEEIVLKRLKGHVESQDLNWTPLTPHTIELKGGDSTIYVETGTLFNSLEAKKISFGGYDSACLVGIVNDGVHAPSGRKLTEILGWMEYGTTKQPPRPLMRPTYDEVQGILKTHWKKIFVDYINRAVR